MIQVFFQGQIPHFLPVEGVQGSQMLLHGVLHLVERPGQPPHLILAVDRQILPGKIVVRNAAGSPRQRQQGPHHGPGQQIQQHQHQCQRHKEQPQIHPGQLLQLVGLCTVSGVLLLQRGLRQPEGVLGEVILQFHHPVHLVHIGLRRRGHPQKGVPVLLVARIALQQVPGAGVALLADLFIIKGQLRQAGFGDLAGRLFSREGSRTIRENALVSAASASCTV